MAMIVAGRCPDSHAKLTAAVHNRVCTVAAGNVIVLVMDVAAAKSAAGADEHVAIGVPVIISSTAAIQPLAWMKTRPGLRFDCDDASGSKPEFWLHLNIDRLKHAAADAVVAAPAAATAPPTAMGVAKDIAVRPRRLGREIFFSSTSLCGLCHFGN